MHRRGLFISFEGIDGAGKTTQLQACAQRLRERGVQPLVTREPGGTAVGERLRAVLLDPASGGMVALCEAMLMAAARAQHVAEVLRPALEAGRVVLCDRYSDATWAYQHGGRGLDAATVETLCRLAEQGLEPDRTILFDLPLEVSRQRLATRSCEDTSRFDAEGGGFQERVAAEYHRRARLFSARIVTVDATASSEEVTRQTWAIVAAILEGKS
jgi:dTMP kinase